MMHRRDGARGDRRDFDVGSLIPSQTQDVFDAAEVGDNAESGLAVLSEGFDDAVVSVAVGIIGLERRHQLGIYTKIKALVKGQLWWDLTNFSKL
jgi:hypothetical protein